MAIIGHAIIGDVAYEAANAITSNTLKEGTSNDHYNSNGNSKSNKNNSSNNKNKSTSSLERITNDRMCLHAHRLSLPLHGGKIETFIAPDPFTQL